MNPDELSEQERFEYLLAMISEGKGPCAGRPRKNCDIPKWRDVGLTRKQVWACVALNTAGRLCRLH
jgi:hypothetical protein